MVHALEDEFNRHLRSLHASGAIDDVFYTHSLSHGAWYGKFYLVPKLHKIPNLSALSPDEIRTILKFRPIVSAPGSPSVALQRALVPVLQGLDELTGASTVVRDSFDFVDRLRTWSLSHPLPQGFELASFDIDSMFTSTPVVPCLEVIHSLYLEHEVVMYQKFKLSATTVVELLRLCCVVLFIDADGNVARQIEGFPMGGPISGVSCQLYVKTIERRALTTFPGIIPIFWVRYADDVFSIIHREFILAFAEHLNRSDGAGNQMDG